MDTNQIHVPNEMRQRYLSRRGKDIQDCVERLTTLDWMYFIRLGHQLKGNAPSYGYDDLGEIAFQIEISALDRDLTKLQVCIQAFQNWYDRQQ